MIARPALYLNKSAGSAMLRRLCSNGPDATELHLHYENDSHIQGRRPRPGRRVKYIFSGNIVRPKLPSTGRPEARTRHLVRRAIGATALCLTSAVGLTRAAADETEPPDDGEGGGAPKIETITVTGSKTDNAGITTQNVPQAISIVTQQLMHEQATTRLEDALRNVPGITLNSGEGGAHGDSVNLRGFTLTDGFFLDGVRDPGSYARDSFDVDSIEVLKGPSAILFGQGSAGGVIDQTAKAPRLAPLLAGTLELGSNREFRGTADIDRPIGDSAALRLAVMGEKSSVTDRDDVQQKRWGIAPSIAFGIGEPTSLTLGYFHQQERDIPDYGIPFLFDGPAPVPRNSYYGLRQDDITQTDVNILTVKAVHDLSDSVTVSDIFRYGNYWSNYRVTAPHFGDDDTDGDGEPPLPAPGTPPGDIVVLRDRPSSSGTETELLDRAELNAKFETGWVAHALTGGFEVGRQTSDLVRYVNQIDQITPAPLLDPNADEPFPGTQRDVAARPSTTADTFAAYVTDTVQLADQWSATGGIRYDRFAASFDEPLSEAHFNRTDQAWSPRAALMFKPTESQTYYVSYSRSFDPSASYLTLAPDNSSPAPERAKTYELGGKIAWLGGQLYTTAALFRTELTNARISDPDDPTLQEAAGQNQRVQGLELGATGYLTEHWEITAGYAHLDPEITASATQGEVGRMLPNTSRNTANLWLTYESDDGWRAGGGMNYIGHRFADTLNEVNVPGYIVWNAMVGYKITDDIDLQLNVKNLTDKYYYDASYYVDPTENHVIPGPGRTFTLTASARF